MPFCANCGSAVEGRFCPKCGTPLGAAAPVGGAAPPPSGAPVGAGATPAAGAASTGLTENAAAALCYVLGLITGILFLVLEPYNRNRTIRFHAFQAIFFNVAWIVVWIVIGILTSMINMTGLFFGTFFLYPLIGLVFFVIYIYLIVSAYQGKSVVLPIIGPLAQKQA
ncbi:MAG TPA: hypothetical protein VLY24_14960 [Bryobacteraceae bacterium]|nr:hypothetical protein [Bryobacteraceae bacterium]